MKPALIAFVLAAFALPAVAQDHSSHNAQTTGESAATTGYRQANARMHQDMDISFTGDPDVDFILSMLPHHHGALDMAEVVLEHGTDPAVRKLAEEIVAAQEAEIAVMTQWLAEHGHATH